MEGTRLRILAFLQQQDGTIAGLTSALGMASATIRRHLEILEGDRLVTHEAVRRKQGRPEYLYRLTEEGQEVMPRRYPLLLQRLLRELVEGANGAGGEEGVEGLFARMARRIAAEHARHMEGAPGSHPVSLLLQVLEEEQFAPSLVNGGEGVRIDLWNCPFRGVALGNASVCAMDEHLIASVLGSPVTSTRRISRGDHHCSYAALAPQGPGPAA